MHGTLKLTSPQPPRTFVELFTLAEIEHYLGLVTLSPIDTERDALITSFIAGAREVAEIFQNRDLVQKQWDLTLDYFPPYVLALRDPLVTVDLVTYKDSGGATTTLAEDTDYIVDLAKSVILPPYNNCWPAFTAWPTSAVLVRFTSGLASTDPFWSDAGVRVKIGMKMLISAWFNGRLPFEPSAMPIQEYPFGVTQLLLAGRNERVR